MPSLTKTPKLFGTLSLLSLLAIFTQVVFLWVGSMNLSFLDESFATSLTQDVFKSKIFLLPFLQLLLSQAFLYLSFTALIWYLTYATRNVFSLNYFSTRLLGCLLWVLGFVVILLANIYFVHPSFFTQLIKYDLLKNIFDYHQLSIALFVCLSIFSFFIIIGLVNLITNIKHKKITTPDKIVLLSFISFASLYVYQIIAATPKAYHHNNPNIIIIGLDALRPDFINNKIYKINSPFIHQFLQSAVNFSESYTFLARTFPSWTTILTGKHPIHHFARGNNTDLKLLDLTQTLPKRLQAAGYQTIYATDDTRFNNTNTDFGFDKTVTPPMGLNDFIIATINDFPLSNLIIPTPLGRILFPYNYANHGQAITYSANNFLQLLQETLHKRADKPLFLAVHFTLSHWPFHWFNDQLDDNMRELQRYATGISAADAQIAEFFKILEKNNLLDNTLLVLLSDHGTTLGLPNDRIVMKNNYLGDPQNIKRVGVSKYISAPENGMDFNKDYGIDTCYGYGGDILSRKQFHTVLAFKGFGLKLNTSITIKDFVSLADITPTILDFVNLPVLEKSDGFSLLPYLTQHNVKLAPRPLFFETTFSLEEIEKENISVKAVLSKALKMYQLDLKSGLIFVKHDAEDIMNTTKHFAVMEDHWWFAYTPNASRSRLAKDPKNPNFMIMESYTLPAYWTLVDLSSGQWTTELNTPFARSAPVKKLFNDLRSFYGKQVISLTIPPEEGILHPFVKL